MEFRQSSLWKDNSLRAYYQLEGDGNDSSGNGFNLSNTVSYVDGIYGKCASFAGSTLLSISNDIGITGGAISISFWAKTTNGTKLSCVGQGDSGTRIRYRVQYGTGSVTFTRIKDGVGVNEVTYTASLGTGWNHIVLTYDGATVRGYVNGIYQVQVGSSGNGTSGASDFVNVGGLSGDAIFTGQLDDVAIFNRALNATEVYQLFSSTAGGFIYNLL